MLSAQLDDTGTVVKPLSQLKPFTPSIFDEVLGYYGHQYKGILDQYEVMKLHVVIDVRHTFATGQPLIGGALRAWAYGPVVPTAWHRIKNCVAGDAHCPVEQIAKKGNTIYLRPTAVFDEDDFTPTQLNIFEHAWNLVKSMPFDRSQRYFHGLENNNAIGYAWKKAKERSPHSTSPLIDWNDILDGGEQLESQDLSRVRALIEL